MSLIAIPDIGDFAEVEVIEILVVQGDSVTAEQPLLTLESDKATMEIPAPFGGTVKAILCTPGDRVSEGDTVMDLAPAAEPDDRNRQGDASISNVDAAQKDNAKAENPSAREHPQKPPVEAHGDVPEDLPGQQAGGRSDDASGVQKISAGSLPHASPAVRKLARELGADLNQIRGSGRKGRILKDDIKAWIKDKLKTGGMAKAAAGFAIPAIPEVDFSQFGETEVVELSRMQKLSGPHLHRAWLNIPHVTHHDEADITDLEAFRQQLKAEAEAQNMRITLLAFMVKILAHALGQYPRFNASLSPSSEQLILKKYINIGVAVDTPDGLVVPVIKNADALSVMDISKALGDVSARARERKLLSDDLSGGSMSISSLGGIGGTAFTPLVNAPEVAILGVSRAKMSAVWNGEAFAPRLILPLALSYDHRVIDGAGAARFTAYLCKCLADVRRIIV